jgi:dihydrofolate reductase
MILSSIVAATENGVIGKDGGMPWRLPAESAYFRKVTEGHPIITGRKNFEAMGRALPNRLNIIITSQKDFKAPAGCIVVHSLEEALTLPEVKSANEVFVIGGSQIYDLAMPLTDKLYLTNIHTTLDGDTFFKYNPSQWEKVWSQEHPADAENKYGFELTILDRKK